MAAHQLQLDGVAELRGNADAVKPEGAHGSWAAASGWTGSVDRLRVAGDIELTLQSPVTLPGRAGSPDAGSGRAGGGQWPAATAAQRMGAGQYRVAGALDGLKTGAPAAIGPGSAGDAFSTDLRLAGSWNLAYHDGWSGQARIAAVAATCRCGRAVTARPIPLLLQQAELQLNAQQGRIALSGLLQTRDHGRAEMLLQLWPAGAACWCRPGIPAECK